MSHEEMGLSRARASVAYVRSLYVNHLAAPERVDTERMFDSHD